MSADRSIEITGESIEEAISKGLAELGVTPAEVIVEVLEEPSRGVFGLGGRQARVRLQLLGTPKPPMPPVPPPAPPTPLVIPQSPPRPEPPSKAEYEAPEPPQKQQRRERSEGGGRERGRSRGDSRPPRPRPNADAQPTDTMEAFAFADDEVLGESLFTSVEEVTEAELDEEASVGKVVLGELLAKMDIRATIVVRRARAAEEGESAPWVLDATGAGQRLIGRRGETLAALQYVTRLITSRELQRRVNLIVDAEGYKGQRARVLQGLALRMAEQAVQQGRTVNLEPMPPHERRIIHLTLRDHAEVVTRSVGEGSGRKVTIVPKNLAK